MTPKLYAKIKRLADDPRTDAMTRKIAQMQLDAHLGVEEKLRNPLHAGMRQSPEYQAYAAAMKRANRGRKA